MTSVNKSVLKFFLHLRDHSYVPEVASIYILLCFLNLSVVCCALFNTGFHQHNPASQYWLEVSRIIKHGQ